MKIGDRELGQGSPAYIIAEIGINHNGELNRAHKMIDIAANCGADAVKFQTFHADQFCGDPSETFTYRSQGQEITESMLEMFRRYELPEASWPELATHCRERGTDFLTTPQDLSDLQLVIGLGLPAIKIGSDDLINTWLISEYRKAGLPIILSSGMAELIEVADAVKAAGWPKNPNVAILVCTSIYPTPQETANLRRIETIRNSFPGLTIGFSDHTQGNLAAVISRSLGAVIFEKHFTESHNLPGPDHWFSANPMELASWISNIRETDIYLGTGSVVPSEAEIPMRRLARRSITALRDIKAGEVLNPDNIGMRRPAGGVDSSELSKFFGKRAKSYIRAWEHVQVENLVDSSDKIYAI
jgi:N,N'-diacetyllegionaminate synthase